MLHVGCLSALADRCSDAGAARVRGIEWTCLVFAYVERCYARFYPEAANAKVTSSPIIRATITQSSSENVSGKRMSIILCNTRSLEGIGLLGA